MPCHFFRYMLLRFREITYPKNVGFPSGIFLSNAKQKKPIVFLLFLRNNEISEAANGF